ncbi:very-long-chain (3R)-3-hydroxyacyl-CoA dehydratase [Synchytrium microbalum]|uniref:Very-long-chain (3R)-3-hydroxyacyl-CoA dehydratase n=1 Tax=Synchytrium microbalum TaxID=1806994 RepID=A0A507BUP9_9FUNG|nr:very-long-chain (3R)-3-hydroxyacyl-CoA dehydratase [Synchytrium microbalum]TPX31008.1 very-long-chain (3R)-3-hydroxyacyl-CoA dehydratase [Synchytrium microbalum]
MSKPSGKSRGERKPSALVTGYLIAYNFASAAGWAYSFALLAKSIITNQSYQRAYYDSGDVVRWVQTAASLEIVHALLGLVKTPVSTTAIQVASRLLLVWGIMNSFNVTEVREHWAYSTMVTAWAITEVTRYVYYGFNLMGLNPAVLLWARYTFFYILYPMGAGSEAMEIYNALPAARAYASNDYLYYLLMGIIAIYPPGFYVMYTHMIGQRRKYLGKAASKKKA